MSDLKYIVIIFGLIAIQRISISGHIKAERYNTQVLAAISDSGCNSHKQLHIEQEHKLRIDKYNLKKGFGE